MDLFCLRLLVLHVGVVIVVVVLFLFSSYLPEEPIQTHLTYMKCLRILICATPSQKSMAVAKHS